MRIHLMDEYQYDKANKQLVHTESGIIYKNYVGVGRVSNYGKPSFYEKLAKVHGAEKAKRIQQSSINRGNSIHKKIQLSNQVVVPGIGCPKYHEVFVYSELEPGCKPVQGSIDDLYWDEDGYHIVEYKSKSSAYKWRKWRSDNIEPIFMQIAAYDRLLFETYGILAKSCNLCVVFADNQDCPEITRLSRQTLNYYYNQFIRNLENF